VRVHVPVGASFSQVADSLEAKGIVRAAPLFKLYARATGDAARVKPGTYAFRAGTGWKTVLHSLVSGDVLTDRIVIPEGWNLAGIAPRIAALTGQDADSILAMLTDSARARALGVPGPTLEGYLYPATYTFPIGVPADTIIARMVNTYRAVWTPERRARADSMGLDEREVVTLASIVEKEARIASEMPQIAAVYHNRARIDIRDIITNLQRDAEDLRSVSQPSAHRDAAPGGSDRAVRSRCPPRAAAVRRDRQRRGQPIQHVPQPRAAARPDRLAQRTRD